MPVSSPNDQRSVPHQLDLVIDFVNTLELETGVDELASARELTSWLVDRQLLEPTSARLRGAQREQAVRLREALRTLMTTHNGAAAHKQAARELEQVAVHGGLTVHFADDGSSQLLARAKGFAGSLARLLIPVAEAGADGSWQRVKACRADGCAWAFYDHSRNRSGVWCDMALCGNRTKVRAYRAKKSSR
jgi:predicted RNA-binding Zn ribbon-like protein